MTNIDITNAAAGDGFFYAPDPSSQIACTIGGNVATNSGGAHCLKYGVTTNNVLGVRMVLMSGEIVDIGGPWPRCAGLRFSRADQRVGRPARRRDRGDRPPAQSGRRHAPDPDRLRLDRVCWRLASPRSSPPASFPWPSNSWIGPPSTSASISYRRRLPARSGSPADRRGRGVRGRDRYPAREDRRNRARLRAELAPPQPERGGERADLEGPQGRVRRYRPALRLLLHGRRHPALEAAQGARRGRLDLPQIPLRRGQYLPCRRR